MSLEDDVVVNGVTPTPAIPSPSNIWGNLNGPKYNNNAISPKGINHASPYNFQGVLNGLLSPKNVGPAKTKLRYIIVKENGDTLELNEASQITPREMIGLTKFLNAVPSYMMASSSGTAPYELTWSALVTNLGITCHFAPGLPTSSYDNDGDTLNIFLYD